MQTTAIGTVTNSLPQNEVILLTLLISGRYISYTDLVNIFDKTTVNDHLSLPLPLKCRKNFVTLHASKCDLECQIS